jgi:predicted nucleotidyltransferase component of viral defense system
MNEPLIKDFVLVGGTSLSLQLGHRVSIDIDLFTDSPYGSVNFNAIQEMLRGKFNFCIGDCGNIVSFGTSYLIGDTKEDAVKLDLFYTEPFIRKVQIIDGIRMASLEDIVAMKLHVMGDGGRKKDFWDLNELQSRFTLNQMLDLYEEKFPYDYTREEIIKGLNDFSKADNEPNPICLKNKQWDFIKLEMIDFVSEI